MILGDSIFKFRVRSIIVVVSSDLAGNTIVLAALYLQTSNKTDTEDFDTRHEYSTGMLDPLTAISSHYDLWLIDRKRNLKMLSPSTIIDAVAVCCFEFQKLLFLSTKRKYSLVFLLNNKHLFKTISFLLSKEIQLALFSATLYKSENRCRHCSLFRVSFTVSSLKTSATCLCDTLRACSNSVQVTIFPLSSSTHFSLQHLLSHVTAGKNQISSEEVVW